MEEKLEWTQQELNDIQYLYTTNNLPVDLAKAYAALPKKKDKTLNMQMENTECYTFLRLIRKRPDYIETRFKILGKGEPPKATADRADEKKDAKQDAKKATDDKSADTVAEQHKKILEIAEELKDIIEKLIKLAALAENKH